MTAPAGGPAVAAATPATTVASVADVPPPTVPETARGLRPGTVGSAALWALGVLLLAVYLVSMGTVTGADLNAMTGLGLVSALPAAAMIAVCGIAVLFVLSLNLRVVRPALLLFLLLATVLCLHGAAALVESEPRFSTAYLHLGFVDYIARTGHTLPQYDARWGWPGFFAVAAFLFQAGGVHNPLPVLQWSQVASQLLCLASLAVILRAIDISSRGRWLALWFFVVGSWIGQDYFSPQAFTYLLYLFFLAVLLGWFRKGGGPGTGELPARGARTGERAVLLFVLLGTFLVAVASHQLTPFVMIAATALLHLCRRSLLGIWFPVLMTVAAAAWLSYLGESYWSGHLSELFGGLGQITGNINSGVTDRVSGDPTHQDVLYLRVLLSAAWFGLAVLGLWRRRRRAIRDRVLPVLAFMPFFTLGMQSYGGEIALRLFLFSLPGVCVLAACAFYPDAAEGARRPGRAATAVLAVAAVLAVSGFGIARYGNETFERVTGGEITAMQYVYAHDTPADTVVYVGGAEFPLNTQDTERVGYQPMPSPTDPAAAPVDPRDDSAFVAALRSYGPQSYLIITQEEGADLEFNNGYPADWYAEARAALGADPRLKQVVDTPDAGLYALAAPVAGKVQVPDVGAIGPVITRTPWTATGVVLLAILFPLLLGRELMRIHRDGRVAAAGRYREWMFAVPAALLVLGFLAVVVSRFLYFANQ